jgi:hypothetical protein
MIATQDGKIVATKGDPDAPVNRGLNCVKGYFNSKILYGKDRLTQPLMRMTDGRFDKKGKFTPVTWDQAFDEMASQFKKAYEEKGPTGIGVIGSGQWLIQEGYAMTKLMKAGFRSNNIDPNARNCMASAVAAFMQVFGIDEPPGNYDDIEYTDTAVAWGANMAEAHPVLWQRVIDRRLGHPEMKIVNITTFRNMTSEGSDLEIIIKPNTDMALLNYLAREIIHRDAVNQAFVDAHCVFCAGPTDIGYGMRATDKFAFEAEKDIQAREIEVTLTRDEAIGLGLDPEQVHTDQAGQRGHGRPTLAGRLRGLQDRGRALHPGLRRRAGQGRRPKNPGCLQGQARAAGGSLRRPESQDGQFLDHGLQSACARDLGQRADLQRASPHGEDLRARQQPLLADRPALRLRDRARGRHLQSPSAGRHGRQHAQASGHHREDLEAAAQDAQSQAREPHHQDHA